MNVPPSGLINIGNTCYLNSVLQCLYATISLHKYLIDENCITELAQNILKNKSSVESELKINIKKSTTYNLKQLFIKMTKNNINDPHFFKMILETQNKMFIGNEQHDCGECLSYILDNIHEETKYDVYLLVNLTDEIKHHKKLYEEHEKNINNGYIEYRKNKLINDAIVRSVCYRETFLKKNYSIISDKFCGLLMYEIKCLSCDNIMYTFDTYTILSIPIKTTNCAFDDCLKDFFTHNILDGDNKYKCNICKKNTTSSIKNYLWSTPEILIIQIKRVNKLNVCNNSAIDCPLSNVDFGNYTFLKSKHKYELYAFICHNGSAQGGHYISYVKLEQWFCINDEKIYNIDKINMNDASILFFRRI